MSLWLISSSSAADPLPGTKPLDEKGDLARLMVDGIHKYLDREIAASVEKRQQLWKLDTSSPDAYAKSIKPNRERLRKYLGVVDARVAPRLEYVGGPGDPSLISRTDKYAVHAVRWAVLPGIEGEGLLLEPTGKAAANIVAIPDADQTPEQLCGLTEGTPRYAQFARRLAENGCRVLVPTLIDRSDRFSENPKIGRATNQPHREFIHRMAYEMGRTLEGYEVQKVLAAVDWFTVAHKGVPVGVYGGGEGGRVGLLAAALDDRIAAVTIGGAFGPREGVASEPIDRNVWGLLTEFGDGDLLRLVFPRLACIEAAPIRYSGPPPTRPGRAGAAPGSLSTPNPTGVLAEIERGRKPAIKGWDTPKKPGSFIAGVEVGEDGLSAGPGHPLALTAFLKDLGIVSFQDWVSTKPADRRTTFDPVARQKRQFDQLVAFTQKLWRDSDAVRKDFWKKADASSPEKWEQSCDEYRRYFHEHVIGKLPDPTVPMNPRSRVVYDEPTWTGYEVALDLYPDVFASGYLLLPKDLKPGEKRPVVVCQHGLEGRPRDVCNPKEVTKYYNSFGARLADRGYIVYAPQNPYIFQNHFRQVQRKANPLGLSLFSFIIAQHRRTLDWLETLPNVDPKRIAFYGLSYGGKTAMRVPAVEKRYCLSICSGDFNEWVGKNVSVDLDRSYMWTGEYEMYEFDLGNTFNYAEMAYLIAPRPFMVERGHDDGVGTDEMVAWEFAKVRYLYANRLKLPGRAEIEFRPGGHEIFLKGTLAFLEKHIGKAK